MRPANDKPAIVPDRAVQDGISRCNQLYRDAGLLVAQGGVKMILLGHELLRLRKQVKHGDWGQMFEDRKFRKLAEFGPDKSRKVAEFAFSWDTADRAMKLAQKAREKIKLLEAHAEKSLASLPEARRDEVLGAIKRAVGAESYQQLAWDWGIAKPPPKLGGHHPRRGGADEPDGSDPAIAYYLSLSQQEQAAFDRWGPTIDILRREGLEEKSWAHLPARELALLKGLVLDLSRLLRPGASAAIIAAARDGAEDAEQGEGD